jgi:DNA-binding MarR family transcriptional regulator
MWKMSLLQDLLTEVPLSALLQERVALVEEKYVRAKEEIEGYEQRIAALERENESLPARIPPESASGLGEVTVRVLVYLFKAIEPDDRDVRAMAKGLATDQSLLQYHLERLQKAGLADLAGENYLHDQVYWALTPEGRRHVVEGKLI